MRGTPAADSASGALRGIIPAYAGNTGAHLVPRVSVRDHPRVCGEHLTMVSYCVSVAGSSPRMRGTPYRLNFVYVVAGIIPAYAGNTRRPWASSAGRKGSSPRMRGTHEIPALGRRNPGIIPAYAGNTCIC